MGGDRVELPTTPRGMLAKMRCDGRRDNLRGGTQPFWEAKCTDPVRFGCGRRFGAPNPSLLANDSLQSLADARSTPFNPAYCRTLCVDNDDMYRPFAAAGTNGQRSP